MVDVIDAGMFTASAATSDALESVFDWGKPDDAFETQEFYELMQAYRWAAMDDPAGTVAAFEAVKEFARDAARQYAIENSDYERDTRDW